MRVLVHDYCGHPFQVQLSRWLAAQGCVVLHLYSKAMPSPRGALAIRPDDPPGFAVEGIGGQRPVAKYELVRRFVQEQRYARGATKRLAAFAPDVVLSGNCSPAIQSRLQQAAKARRAAFVYWLQDIYAFALERALHERLPRLAKPIADAAARFELATIARSDAVVAITEDFVPILADGGVPRGKITVVENWAPLEDPAPASGAAAWRRAHGLDGHFVFLYSGTLGLKHNPELLAALARAYRHEPEVAVVVASEGRGRDYLERAKAREQLDNLVLLDFQPIERLRDMASAADVLVAVLESHAGTFSVPSKILTYLAAGRPILAAIPDSNLAARSLAAAGAGLVVRPDDEAALLAAARRLRADGDVRRRLGRAGRAYAERTFDIDVIGRRFLEVLERSRGWQRSAPCAAPRAHL